MLISSRVVVEGAASGSEGCNKRMCGGDYSRLMVVKKHWRTAVDRLQHAVRGCAGVGVIAARFGRRC